jgi:hypothetical protein
MRGCLPRGILTISIDVHGDASRAGEALQPCVELLHKHQLPATWAFADPAAPLAERLVRGTAGHEIALFGDPTWVGRAAGRARFAHKLGERLERARATGIAISSLVLQGAVLGDQADLAIKHGITAVRHGAAETRPTGGSPGRTLQGGLWNFSVGQSLPGISRWLLGGGGGGRARAAIDLAIAERSTLHLAIDAGRLATSGHGAWRVLEGVLRYTSGRRAHGLLDVIGLRSAAARLTAQYQAQPSRSILRAA